MSYKAIYAYAWDLAETGWRARPPAFAASVSTPSPSPAATTPASSCDRMATPARSISRRMAPSIFAPTERLYGAIKPIVSRIARERDVLRELCDFGAIGVNVWLVLLHNTSWARPIRPPA